MLYVQSSEPRIGGGVKSSAPIREHLCHTGCVSTLRTARDRARSDVTRQILDTARSHLADHGAAGLSLRAVARDLGLVSSAVYRYVESRDALLTALIVEAYDALGAVAEAASATDGSASDRWVTTAVAIREWAVGHRHEYLLLFGTPVPGYAAPADTVGPALRTPLALVGIVREAHAAGSLEPTADVPDPEVARQLGALAAQAAPGLPAAALYAAVLAWTQLFGLLSFELTAQTRGMVDDDGALFRAAAATAADRLGLR